VLEKKKGRSSLWEKLHHFTHTTAIVENSAQQQQPAQQNCVKISSFHQFVPNLRVKVASVCA